MKKEDLIDYLSSEDFMFKLKRYASEFGFLYRGVKVPPEQFIVKIIEGEVGQLSLRLLLDVATQEDDLCSYPCDWWQAFKERWFPAWAKRKTPVRMTEVLAVHKYPELAVPENPLGREFVHLRYVDSWALQDKLSS